LNGYVWQVLNVKTFDAIGAVGVYYGTKLGHRVDWNNGFPFNVVSHPQYVGSVLTVWGLLLGAKSIYPTIPLISTMVVGSYWTAMYVITGLIEQYL
jgi:phosphatidyl-N-methylethanolamine N-methyltransferase